MAALLVAYCFMLPMCLTSRTPVLFHSTHLHLNQYDALRSSLYSYYHMPYFELKSYLSQHNV